jgi:hypothetical protein
MSKPQDRHAGRVARHYEQAATREIVQAIRWVRDNTQAVAEFTGTLLKGEDNGKLIFHPPHGGILKMSFGEWIVRFPDDRTIIMENRCFQFAFEKHDPPAVR